MRECVRAATSFDVAANAATSSIDWWKADDNVDWSSRCHAKPTRNVADGLADATTDAGHQCSTATLAIARQSAASNATTHP